LRGGYHLQGIYSLAENEVAVVLDAMHVFGVHLNDPEAHVLMDRLQNLPAQFGAKLVLRKSRTLRQRDIYSQPGGLKANVQDILMQAIRARMPVAMTYQTPRLQEAKQFKGYPLFLVFHERGWYCLTKDMDGESYFPRRLDRIRQCKLLERTALNESHEEDLNTAQLLMNSGWGMTFPHSLQDLAHAQEQEEIVVRFDSSVAAYILESGQRHPRGKTARARDGSGDVEFKIRLSDAREFVFWVRSFGSKARITAPLSLVESERAEVRRMAQAYGLQG
jgi:predicted DNA-binding transcriptional regulator YafY